ncbi:MAG: hypothetical protein ACJZ8M_05215 [Pseudohongiellaceae bacterium]
MVVQSSTTTATITVESSCLYPNRGMAFAPYSGVTPDTSLWIGVQQYRESLTRAMQRSMPAYGYSLMGLPVQSNGVGEFDIGLEVVSLYGRDHVQITKSREFNTIGALNEKVQAPDCSGIFETTTGLYTDILQANSSVLETVWSLIDSTKLILKLSKL